MLAQAARADIYTTNTEKINIFMSQSQNRKGCVRMALLGGKKHWHCYQLFKDKAYSRG